MKDTRTQVSLGAMGYPGSSALMVLPSGMRVLQPTETVEVGDLLLSISSSSCMIAYGVAGRKALNYFESNRYVACRAESLGAPQTQVAPEAEPVFGDAPAMTKWSCGHTRGRETRCTACAVFNRRVVD